MPEGPEVAVLTYYLNKSILNEKLKDIEIISGKYVKQTNKSNTIENINDFKKALPLKITDISCKGKFIYMKFNDKINNKSSTNWYCFLTLGLSGRIILKTDFDKQSNDDEDDVAASDESHIRVKFTTDKNIIYYMDMRNFGTIHFYEGNNVLEDKLNKKLGYDMLNGFDIKEANKFIINKLSKYKNQDEKLIGDLLLDQKIFTGVGNYIRADALYLSKISPFTKLSKLVSSSQCKESYPLLKTLIKNINKIMKRSYDDQISHMTNQKKYNYRNQTTSHPFYVYQRKTTDKGEKIIGKKMKNNRMIWYVPSIQK